MCQYLELSEIPCEWGIEGGYLNLIFLKQLCTYENDTMINYDKLVWDFMVIGIRYENF